MRIDPRFRELYEAEYAAVFRAVYALCGDRAVAEDATQEAFARCLERWNRLEGRPWVAGWVTTTALNVARRAMRRRWAPDPPSQEESDPEASIDLWRGIRSLPRRQQEAVILHYGLGLSISEAAATMRCAEGTVKVHLGRARESLRRSLEGEPVEG